METDTLSPDPIDPLIRAEIAARLAAIESDRDVRILYACESGSRGWGFASPDSDYDVRFIYVHPLPWYLRVSPQRDVIEQPISEALDISGWELRKALGLLKKGNATLIEWLSSPILYRADTDFLAALRETAHGLHQPERSFHHYIHTAGRNYREYLCGERIRLKKYLYALRPLLATLWIEQGRGPAPMRFDLLVEGLIADPALRADIEHLLALKRAAGEMQQGPPLPRLNTFIARELERLESVRPPSSTPANAAALDRLLLETVTGGSGRL